jgi:hypothetical protein
VAERQPPRRLHSDLGEYALARPLHKEGCTLGDEHPYTFRFVIPFVTSVTV